MHLVDIPASTCVRRRFGPQRRPQRPFKNPLLIIMYNNRAQELCEIILISSLRFLPILSWVCLVCIVRMFVCEGARARARVCVCVCVRARARLEYL